MSMRRFYAKQVSHKTVWDGRTSTKTRYQIGDFQRVITILPSNARQTHGRQTDRPIDALSPHENPLALPLALSQAD